MFSTWKCQLSESLPSLYLYDDIYTYMEIYVFKLNQDCFKLDQDHIYECIYRLEIDRNFRIRSTNYKCKINIKEFHEYDLLHTT